MRRVSEEPAPILDFPLPPPPPPSRSLLFHLSPLSYSPNRFEFIRSLLTASSSHFVYVLLSLSTPLPQFLSPPPPPLPLYPPPLHQLPSYRSVLLSCPEGYEESLKRTQTSLSKSKRPLNVLCLCILTTSLKPHHFVFCFSHNEVGPSDASLSFPFPVSLF